MKMIHCVTVAEVAKVDQAVMPDLVNRDHHGKHLVDQALNQYSAPILDGRGSSCAKILLLVNQHRRVKNLTSYKS
jgi:hypothetical protein